MDKSTRAAQIGFIVGICALIACLLVTMLFCVAADDTPHMIQWCAGGGAAGIIVGLLVGGIAYT